MICRVFRTESHLAIQAPFEYKDACKSVPGARWDKTLRAWTYPATPGAARSIHQAFSASMATWSDDAAALLLEAERIAGAAASKLADDLPPIPITKTQPWTHQKRAFWFAVKLLGGLPDANH